MNFNEIRRVLLSIIRRWTNPEENPLTIRQMSWFYVQRKTYLLRHPLPAIKVPFAFAHEAPSPEPRIAVIVHCFYPDLAQELLTHIKQIPFPYQLYVSTDTEEKRKELIHQIEQHKIRGAEVRLAPNRGRDIAPKYITFRDVYDRCDYFLHLHSKKSTHSGSWGEEWRRYLLHTLVGSPEIVRSNLLLLSDKRLGLVFPVPMNDTTPSMRWGATFNVSLELAQRLGVNIRPEFCSDFPDGSMFWGKAVALKPLLDLKLQFEDFSEEKGQYDGCLNHAIERLVINCALKQGLSGCRVSAKSSSPRLQIVPDEAALAERVSVCLAAQELERIRCDRPARKSQPPSAP